MHVKLTPACENQHTSQNVDAIPQSRTVRPAEARVYKADPSLPLEQRERAWAQHCQEDGELQDVHPELTPGLVSIAIHTATIAKTRPTLS